MVRSAIRQGVAAALGAALMVTGGWLTVPSAHAATGVTISVSPSGSDSAAGTSAAPIRTLGEAQARVRAALDAGSTPVTVELGDGTYALSETLRLDERDSGSPGTPVTWRAAEGATPVVAGGRVLSPSWSVHSGQILVADIGAGLDFDQLLVDGSRQVLARYPNYDPNAILGGHSSDATSTSRVAGWAHPETALVRGLHDREWGGNSFRSTGRNSDGSLALTWVGDNQRGSGMSWHHRMVENVFEELDTESEWFYDSSDGKLYYWPPSEVNPTTATFQLAELDELIRVEGAGPASPAHDITFSGLTFTGTHRTLFNSTFEPISLSDWAIVRKGSLAMKNTARVTVTGSTFSQVGGNAVFIDGYGSANTVDGNVFTGSGASDVAVVGAEKSARQASTWGNEIRTMTDTTPGPATEDYPRDIMISNNDMSGMGVFEKQTAGVQIARAFRVSAIRNTIHDGPRAGVNIGDGTFGGHLIQGNDIWRMVKETGDHGPINSWGRDRFWPIEGATDAQRKSWSKLDHIEPTVIEHNRIWHHSDWAVDLDDGSSNYIVRHNLLLDSGTKFREGFNRVSHGNIYANGSAHFHVSYADNNDQVTSNIFLTETPYVFIQADPAHSKIAHSNNVFWNNGGPVGFQPYGADLTAWQQTTGTDTTGSIVADPRFEGTNPWSAPSKKDYILQSDSPALDRGFTQLSMDSFGRPGSTEAPPAVNWPDGPTATDREAHPELWLGATVTGLHSDTLASSVGLSGRDGLYLESVPSGTLAHTAGLRSGDVIQRVDGTDLTQKNSFWTIWNTTRPGTELALAVWRNQAATTVTLTRPGGTEKINNTSGVLYTGAGWSWRGAASGGQHNWLDDIDASQNSGDSMSLTFTGSRLKMITETFTDEATIMISLDNGPEQEVSLVTPNRVYQSTVFDTGELPAGTHTLTARSTSGGYFVVDAFEITRPSAMLNDTAPGIDYSGAGWWHSTNRNFGDHGNDVHATRDNGDSFSYTFTGTGVDLISEKYADQGLVDVFVDGTLRASVDATNPNRLTQQVIYTVRDLAPGEHTIRAVKRSGDYMLLDRIDVFQQ